MLSNDFLVLLVGRALGGLSTTLLFSVFETWMITEYHNRGLDNAGLDLSDIFGSMTTLSSVVAILAGVLGDFLVQYSASRTTPFLASIVCLAVAALLIWTRWVRILVLTVRWTRLINAMQPENYGGSANGTGGSTTMRSGIGMILKGDNGVAKRRSKGKLIWCVDTRILSVAVASCFFEGTMYLFIFFWTAALKSAREQSGMTEGLPFGLIFSCFMCMMMLGSRLFATYIPSQDSLAAPHMLLVLTAIASSCLFLSILSPDERLTFWAFCLFEGCIGVYFPCMAVLKGKVVGDEVRGMVYGMLRLPLNVFVVVTHSLAEEGRYSCFGSVGR